MDCRDLGEVLMRTRKRSYHKPTADCLGRRLTQYPFQVPSSGTWDRRGQTSSRRKTVQEMDHQRVWKYPCVRSKTYSVRGIPPASTVTHLCAFVLIKIQFTGLSLNEVWRPQSGMLSFLVTPRFRSGPPIPPSLRERTTPCVIASLRNLLSVKFSPTFRHIKAPVSPRQHSTKRRPRKHPNDSLHAHTYRWYLLWLFVCRSRS